MTRTPVKFAKMDTFAQKAHQICTKMLLIGTLLHEVNFAQGATYAQRVSFAQRLLCMG